MFNTFLKTTVFNNQQAYYVSREYLLIIQRHSAMKLSKK